MFQDRKDAGKKLAEKLEKFRNESVIVLAVPRGGIVVAHEAIRKFGFQWDLIIPRKIGAPLNKEVAIGAVSADGSYFVDDYYVQKLGISKKYIEKEVASEVHEIKRRLREYKGSEAFPDVQGKTVILIDDGIATGFTILAAVKSVKAQRAAKTVLAVPVAPKETIDDFKDIVDEIICLYIPDDFYSVGLYYRNFEQVTDQEVFTIMKELKR